MGGSRGGSPAYLAKIRDCYYGENQIDMALITMGSGADLFTGAGIAESGGKYIVFDGYIGEPDPLYDYEYLPKHHYYNEDYNVFKYVLEPYLTGEMTAHEALVRMIRSSPVHFAEYLDDVQFHHGELDLLVRLQQSWDMYIALYLEGALKYEIHQYDGVYHTIGKDDTDKDNDTFLEVTNGWLHDYGGFGE